jgi:protein involved in polysaccharide export with SLBB domain
MFILTREKLLRFGVGALLAVGVMSCTGSTLVAQHPLPMSGPDRYQVGDRIYIDVRQQDNVKVLADTFTVADGPAVTLPDVGKISLAGVTYPELEQLLTREIARYYINPVVHAQTLIRLEVRGAVGHPGFHAMPTDALIDAVLMRAGGPLGDAKMNELTFQRGDTTLWSGDSIRVAIADGRTIGQLGLRSGDALVVERAADTERMIRIISIVLTIPAAIIGLKLLFK